KIHVHRHIFRIEKCEKYCKCLLVSYFFRHIFIFYYNLVSYIYIYIYIYKLHKDMLNFILLTEKIII
ncbi:MAG: hypothetical protein MCS20_02055, partial [Candidatus Phytoplasma mali]|nr:hypothetical protein [Candidatus Phytoplasma australiense]MBZ7920153.1 hypothetical protein [Candidatus Karelsulcia muelleri]MCG7202174.1 hypothetical protein [Candidatus Phytoplasma mali]MCZ8632836.1 hypothetical protein [Spiroplasma sp. Tabriz.8]